MTTLRKDGGRNIELFLPFEHKGEMISVIGLAPVTWSHTLKWQGGEYSKSTDLLFELAEHSEDIIRSIRYPDVDRVMTQFFEMLPPEIRDSIANGTIPRKVVVPNVEESTEQSEPEPINSIYDQYQGPDIDEPEEKTEAYEPYRHPTKADIENDLKAHPPPEDPFAHLPKDENGLGFEVDDDGR